MGIITDINAEIDETVADYAEAVFGALSAEILPVFQVGAALALVILGFAIWFQATPVSPRTGFAWVLRIGIALLLAESYANFAFIVAFMTNAPVEAGAIILAAGDGGTEASLYELMDGLVDATGDAATRAGEEAGTFSVSLVSVLLGVVGVLVAVAAVIVMITAKIGLAFALGIAPLALLATLFKATSDFFTQWLKLTIGFALIPFVLAGVMGVTLSMAEVVTSRGSRDLSTIGSALGFITVLLATAALIAKVPSIASQLTGSIVTGGYGVLEAAGYVAGPVRAARTMRAYGREAGAAWSGVRGAGARAASTAASAATAIGMPVTPADHLARLTRIASRNRTPT